MVKAIEKVVKFEGGTALVWKHPLETVDENTTVICPHTHEIVCIRDGQLMESLKPGLHHPLEKEKSGLFARHDKKQYYCHYLFVNVTSTTKMLWGTPNRMELFDPKINMPVSIGLKGTFVVRIENARKFISKLAGIDERYSPEALQDFFRGIIPLYIKESLANAMLLEKISFYDLWLNMRKISDAIRISLLDKFMDYGVELCEFMIEHVAMSDDVKKMIEDLYRQKYELDLKGLTFQQVYEDHKVRETEHQPVKETPHPLETGPVCPKCGTRAGEDDVFCRKCGNRLKAEVVPVICPQCGKVLEADAVFCPQCGTRVQAGEAIPEKAREPEYCSECGETIEPGAQFCARCGHKVGEEEIPYLEADE